jgi:hypothetical protein
MNGLPNGACRPFLGGHGLRIGAAILLAALLFTNAVAALPLGAPAHRAPAASQSILQPVRGGGCKEPCPDCPDCIPEIDITPGPYPAPSRAYPDRDDPIGHAIKRLEPSPLLAPDSCPDEGDPQRGEASSGCGIRCWYWRLRYGYCGPGCDYYRFRLGLRDGAPASRGAPVSHRPAHGCKS